MPQASLDSLLKQVLSGANKEQNMHYPPHIFETHFNVVTAWLLDRAVELYPTTQSVVDVIRPFLVTKEFPVDGGYVKLPDEYRNLLRVAFNVTDDYKKDCGSKETAFANDPLKPLDGAQRAAARKAKCISHPCIPVDTDEWDDLTTHPYKKPTLKRAIYNIFDSTQVRICPHGISYAELTFVRRPKQYRYAYTMNPDDTYVFNPTGSEESEWNDNAVKPLLTGLNTLYSMYVKDGEMQNWNMELKKIGLF
jgi:hypothetical protein